jgi:hypothetical protein
MKMKKILMVLLIALSLQACKKTDDSIDFPPEIDQVIHDLTSSFDTLNADLAGNAAAIAMNPADTTGIRMKLQEMYNRTSFVVEFAYVSPEKILQIVEPSLYYPSQGTDISQQDHIVKIFETKQPVLSQSFEVVEGYNAVIDMYPILDNTGILGTVAGIFPPHVILGRIIAPYVSGETFEIWVMESGGNVLYDQDSEEIGLNVITDPLYADFPELIAAAQRIDSEESGETTYSFYQTGTNNKVVKKTYWKTFKLLDNQWKIVWVIPI